LYFISHLISSKSKEAANKHKISQWSYHIALLTKKLLDIKISNHGAITDKTIKDTIEKIEKNFDIVSAEAIKILKTTAPRKNEHMSKEKTLEIKTAFENERKNKHRTTASSKDDIKAPTKINSSTLPDGNYRVKNITKNNSKLDFTYGNKKYSLPDKTSTLNEAILQQGIITIQQGEICNIGQL